MTHFSAPHSEHLLPPNATQLEKALAASTRRITDLPVEIRKVWNADTCPAGLLPWLAWMLSVDFWEPDWDEATKRAVIKASMDIHRHKGTRYALEKAIELLNMGLKVEEWFEYGGTPYHFRVLVNVPSGQPIYAHSINRVYRTAIANKNVRSFLEVVRIARAKETATLNVSAFPVAKVKITLRPAPLENITPPRAHLYAAGYPKIKTRTRVYPRIN